MIYIEGLEGGKPVFHVVESGWVYTERVSLNGFHNRMVMAYLRTEKYSERERCCWERLTKVGFDKRLEHNPRIPVVRHKDLWTFYNYIGYDHKKSSTRKVVWK